MQILVQPHYLQLLHGNFTSLDEPQRAAFVGSMQRALDMVEPASVAALLNSAWREQLSAAWVAGLKQWTHFEPHIGEQLLASRSVDRPRCVRNKFMLTCVIVYG